MGYELRDDQAPPCGRRFVLQWDGGVCADCHAQQTVDDVMQRHARPRPSTPIGGEE